LGLTINENLNWNSQVNSICKKLNSANFALYSLKNKVSVDSLLMVYFGYVFSYINLNIVNRGSNDGQLFKNFKLQKRAVRTYNY
jgi:hypothetical protein